MNEKHLVLSCIFIFYFFSSYSQISNEGIIQITSSTLVSFEDEYTNSSTGVHTNNGDLYLNSNFINNGITNSNSGTTIFSSSDYESQNISGTTGKINFYNLEVNLSTTGKKGLTVDDNFGVSVTNAVALSGGDLRLVGEAQLIQTHLGVNTNVIGSGKLLRDQQGISSVYGFNYWSSPVNNGGSFKLNGGLFDGSDTTISPYSPQQVLINSGSPYNGAPSVLDGGGNVTTPLTINNRWLYKYSQSSNWVSIDENTLLDTGVGYTMKGTNTILSNQNYVFKGVPNNGEYQIPISSGESVLLGNPYPSSIDCDKFINDNLALISGSLYFWVDGGSASHNLSNYLGGYAIRNIVTGILPSIPSSLISGLGDSNLALLPTQYISVAQGFFIQATGTGNIQFDNSQRIFKTESSSESNYYRTAEENSIIRIGYEDPEGFHRQIALGFMPNSNADINYNAGYDALMFDIREDELFYKIENDTDKKYVIQGVGAYDALMEFPLGMIITEAGTHTIMLDGTENFNSTVYIKDTYLQTYYNLSEGDFSPALAPGEYLDRFKVVFIKGTLNNNEYIKEGIDVFYDGNNNLIINNPNTFELNDISIINTLGQVIYQNNEKNLFDSLITIPFRETQGLYFVNVTSNQKQNTYKILKY